MAFVCISETWLNPKIENRFCLGDEYMAFYKSRETKVGGGSAIFAYDKYFTGIQKIILHEFKTAEVVTLQVTNGNKPSFLICQIYRPPDNEWEFLLEMEQFLSALTALNMLAFIAGDFNFDLFSINNNSANESFLH